MSGTPLIARQLRAYAECGVSPIYVVTGYFAEVVGEVCSSISAEYEGVDIIEYENPAFANTDNLYSLYQVTDAVAGEPFVLSNGDVAFDPAVVERLLSSPAESAIACDTTVYSEEGMKITLDEQGYVNHISKEVDSVAAYATSADIYRFSAEFSERLFDRIERTVEVEREYGRWTEAAIDDLLSRRGHGVEPVDIAGTRWVEVDDYDDLLRADRTFSSIDEADIAAKEAVFFDLDGTLYLDERLVDGAAELVATLREGGTDVYFLSNNTSRRKADYADKLDSLGIRADPDAVVLPTDGVIAHLERSSVQSTYVVGTAAMRQTFRERGLDPTATEPEAVVVGFDTELTYEKVREATLAIRDGAEFLLAHPDLVCPTKRGFVPDCGSIGALVSAATSREPDAVFGKPNAEMLERVLERRGLAPEDVVIVGDRLSTEIQLAERVGCDSVCVLTGDTDRAMIEESEFQPTLVVPDVGALVRTEEPVPTAPDESV